jgi:putative glutamine amidotransferase
MTDRARPRIGITMRIESDTDRFYLSRHYSEAVEAAGGAPVHIPLIPHAEFIGAAVGGLDGILLPGSDSDVDPLRYDRDPHPKLGCVQPEKDETDLLALEEIERLKMPLFAICYGVQILNVSRGGTLIQDIESQWPAAIKHEQGAPRDRHSHAVRMLPDSLLARLAQSGDTKVNSHHHQAIETLGRELIATAWASDGLLEAVEDPRSDRFVMGVQWHPELGWERDQLSRTLFRYFVDEAKSYSDQRAQRSQDESQCV